MAVPAYKFYRFVVRDTAATASKYYGISDILFYRDSAQTIPVSTTGAITTASTINWSNNSADKAIDTNINTEWLSANTTGDEWWQIEFSQPESIQSVSLRTATYAGYTFNSMDVLASNDGVNWITLQNLSGFTQAASTYYSYPVLPTAFRKLEISHDVYAPSVVLRQLGIEYTANAPAIITGSVGIEYAANGTPYFYSSLNQSYNVDAPAIKRFRIINDWGLLPGWTVISRIGLNMTWATAPGIGTASITLPAITASARGGARASVSLPAITASGFGAAGDIGVARIALPKISATVRAASKASVTLPAIVASGSGTFTSFGRASISLPAIRVNVAGNGGTSAAVSIALPKPTVRAIGLTGTTGSASVALRAPTVNARGVEGFDATASISLPAITASGTGYTSHDAKVSIVLPKLRMASDSRTADGAGVFSGWALNLESKLLSEYAGLTFNSMCEFHGVTLAAHAGGLSVMEGNLDDLYTIDAHATTSQDDFDSHFLKRIRDAWVGLRADGELRVKTITDENVVRIYPLSRVRSGLHEQRVKLGRGVKSRYWQFGIENVDGADFQLESVKIEPQVLSRRVR